MSLQNKVPALELASEATEGHYFIAEQVAIKYRNLQPDNRLDDVIDEAAKGAVIRTCEHYSADNLTDGLIATCVKNAIITALSCKKNSAIFPSLSGTFQDVQVGSLMPEALPTDDLVDLKRQRELLRRFLGSRLLTDKQKQLLALVASDEDFSQRQIARMLGVQQPAVSKQYRAAIAKLRAAFTDCRGTSAA